MDELNVLIRKNKLDIMIIEASHRYEKNKTKKLKEGLETLTDILTLIHELQDEIRSFNKVVAKLKYENAVAYKDNALLKTQFAKYKEDLIKAENEKR